MLLVRPLKGVELRIAYIFSVLVHENAEISTTEKSRNLFNVVILGKCKISPRISLVADTLITESSFKIIVMCYYRVSCKKMHIYVSKALSSIKIHPLPL